MSRLSRAEAGGQLPVWAVPDEAQRCAAGTGAGEEGRVSDNKGRIVPSSHVDEDPLNNRNDNLVILQGRGEHMRLHARLRVLRAGGNPWTQAICGSCRQLVLFADLTKAGKAYRVYRTSQCRKCAREYHQRLRDARKSAA